MKSKLFLFLLTGLSFLWAENSGAVTVKCSRLLAPSYLIQAVEYKLESSVRDSTRVRRFYGDQLLPYAIEADSKGRVTYKSSKQRLHTGPDQSFVTVWSIEENQPAGLYGVVDESERQSDEYKHSSFSANQPVAGAWMMKMDQGIIREIIDGSGHYQPTPWNMYLAVRHLSLMGFDLDRADIVFEYGLDEVGGLRMSAIEFIKTVENLSQPEQKKIDEVRFSRKNLRFFLDLFKPDAGSYSEALIHVYWIRNGPREALEEHVLQLAKYLSRRNKVSEVEYFMEALFRNRVPKHFAYRPVYFDLPEDEKLNTLRILKRLLLASVSHPEVKGRIEAWLSDSPDLSKI